MTTFSFVHIKPNQCASLLMSDLRETVLRGQRGVAYVIPLDSYREYLTLYMEYLSKYRAHPKYHKEYFTDDAKLKRSLLVEIFKAQMCELELAVRFNRSASYIVPDDEEFYPTHVWEEPDAESIYRALQLHTVLTPDATGFSVEDLSEYNKAVFYYAVNLRIKFMAMIQEAKEA